MKTIVLNKPGEFQLLEQPEIAAAQTDEVIVKIQRVGICGTDYHAYRGKQPFFSYPRVLGHELGAEVVAIGGSQANSSLRIGDRVAIEPYLNCGICQPCRNGKGNCCENINVLGVHTDGGMTEFLKLPISKVHVSNQLDFEELALVEMLGIGMHAVSRACVHSSHRILIIGAGPIGLSVAQFCKINGAEVMMADFSASRLRFAKENRLADCILLVDNLVTENVLREQMDGDLPTIIFDATGNKESMLNCFNIASHAGKIVFVGLFQGEVAFNDPNFHRRELTLLSSRNALSADFRRIIKLMEEKQIETKPWLTHRVKFEGLPDVFPHWLKADSGVVKAMVEL